MRRIDEGIRRAAMKMVDLIKRRRALSDRVGLGARWSGPGLDVWDLLDDASSPHEQSVGASTATGAHTHLFDIAPSLIWSGLELEDVLRLVSESEPGQPFARDSWDAESLSKTQGAAPGAWSEHVRSFFAALAQQRWRESSGRQATALDCFTPHMLSVLMNVAAGFDPHDGGPASMTVESIDRARRRYQRMLDRRTTSPAVS